MGIHQGGTLAIKRPLVVTLIGWLFIAAGIIGIAYHATEFRLQEPFAADLLWPLSLRLLAIVGGAFALRGANWARWLLVVWLGYHVFLSISHSVPQLAIHAVLLVVIAYGLFRKESSGYFQKR